MRCELHSAAAFYIQTPANCNSTYRLFLKSMHKYFSQLDTKFNNQARDTTISSILGEFKGFGWFMKADNAGASCRSCAGERGEAKQRTPWEAISSTLPSFSVSLQLMLFRSWFCCFSMQTFSQTRATVWRQQDSEGKCRVSIRLCHF